MSKPEQARARHRAVVVDHAPLVSLLRELYPRAMPSMSASDREVWTFMAEQRVVERLELLLEEARHGSPGSGAELPKVL